MSNYPSGVTQVSFDRETDRMNETPEPRHTLEYPHDPQAFDRLRRSLEATRLKPITTHVRLPMKATEEPICQRLGCDNSATNCCDNCNRYFCSDHGTEGGDRETQDVGMVAYPSRCWACGGFDADGL